MSGRNLLPLMLAVSTSVGCRTSGEPGVQASPTASAPLAKQPSPSPAESELDALDQRTPLPLLPMMANHQKQSMRDHLLVVQEIVTAVAAKNFDAVQTSVRRIGYSEQMGQMCEHMGAGAPGFTELALQFHHGADQIGEAARKQDPNAVLQALSNTLATCASCHRTYKQQVVGAGSVLPKVVDATLRSSDPP